MKNPIAILGAGGFGKEVLMLIHQINEVQPVWEFAGFYDDARPRGEKVNNYPIVGGISDLNDLAEELFLVLAIGNPITKAKILSKLHNDRLRFATLIHPGVSAKPYQFLRIGEGTIICAGNIITTNISIGKHVILNLDCTVGHDAVIGDRSSFMPSVNISGEVVIEEDVYCGTGATIINQVTIGKGSIIGGGAMVAKNIPAHCTAVGVPAKPIKFHHE